MSATDQAVGTTKLPILDGWRATSILLVLAAHLLPLGPSTLQLNHVAGAMGMALFFTLSGFLITRFLADGMDVTTFVIRRVARILPLAWLTMAVLAIWNQSSLAQTIANILFYSNLPPTRLLPGGEHLWSICVEMQFYALAAALALLPGRRGLLVIPFLCVCVTATRIWQGAYISIFTWQRVDEILAGGTIALWHLKWLGAQTREHMTRISFWPSLMFLIVSSHPDSGFVQYLRPYAAALLVAGTLAKPPPRPVNTMLLSRPFGYVAEISYALYMIHGVLLATWLGQGERFAKYLKRPFLLGLTFLLAHASTRYFEKPVLAAARRFGRRPKATVSEVARFPGDQRA